MLALVAFHAFMATFTAAAIQSAFVNIAMDLDVSIQAASYLTSLVIAILGGAPLFWRPLADRWGRMPIFLLSLVGSLVANIGCANSPAYGSMAACRAIVAFCISPAAAIGSAIVTELFFKRERAKYMGIWTVMVTLGVPISPFIFGFVALRVDYRWIYYILAIVSRTTSIFFNLANALADQCCATRPLSSLRFRDVVCARLRSFAERPRTSEEDPILDTPQPTFALIHGLCASAALLRAALRSAPSRLVRHDLRFCQCFGHH